MATHRRRTKRQKRARRAARRRPAPTRQMLAVLARRTNDLFVELATLSGRLAYLEDALRRVRQECANLVQRRLRRLVAQGQRRRLSTRRRPPAPRLLAAARPGAGRPWPAAASAGRAA